MARSSANFAIGFWIASNTNRAFHHYRRECEHVNFAWNNFISFLFGIRHDKIFKKCCKFLSDRTERNKTRAEEKNARTHTRALKAFLNLIHISNCLPTFCYPCEWRDGGWGCVMEQNNVHYKLCVRGCESCLLCMWMDFHLNAPRTHLATERRTRSVKYVVKRTPPSLSHSLSHVCVYIAWFGCFSFTTATAATTTTHVVDASPCVWWSQ